MVKRPAKVARHQDSSPRYQDIPPGGDQVDRARAQWRQEWPELDTFPIAVIARLGRLAGYVDAHHERFFDQHGLTRAHWDVLACLRRAGPPYRLTPTELHQGLMRSTGTVTHRLHQLEEKGLIERRPDPADGRGLLVGLTRRGRALVDRLAVAHLDHEREFLAGLSAAQQRQLAGLLGHLLAAVEQRYPMPGSRDRRR
jgi:DNA-binding MarR family transcriptional regulator